MIPGWSRFQVELTFPVDEDDVRLRVSGKCSPYWTAKLTGHPDAWEPPQGLELEDLTIERLAGEVWLRFQDAEHARIEQHPHFADAVIDAIMELK